jgi:hypothetical protein
MLSTDIPSTFIGILISKNGCPSSVAAAEITGGVKSMLTVGTNGYLLNFQLDPQLGIQQYTHRLQQGISPDMCLLLLRLSIADHNKKIIPKKVIHPNAKYTCFMEKYS